MGTTVPALFALLLACSPPSAPPPPALPAPPAGPTSALNLEDATVFEAVRALATAAERPAVLDPSTIGYGRCAHVSVISPGPRPVGELVTLVAAALGPSGFTLTQQPEGLVLRHDGEHTPVGCAERATAAPTPMVPFDAPVRTPSTGPLPTEAALDRGIRRVSDTEYLIARSAVTQIFDESSLAQSARVVPYVVNGQPHGVRMFGIRASSVPSKLGIQNGDIIVSVAGHSLDSPEDALQAYTVVREASRIPVVIERRGATRTHIYRVVSSLPAR